MSLDVTAELDKYFSEKDASPYQCVSKEKKVVKLYLIAYSSLSKRQNIFIYQEEQKMVLNATFNSVIKPR